MLGTNGYDPVYALKSATVTLTEKITGGQTLAATTGDDGSFQFSGVAGLTTYTLTIDAGINYAAPVAQDVQVQSGNVILDDVKLPENPGSVSGVITSADHIGVPLKGMTATLYRNGTILGTADTDGSGAYTITGVTSGSGYSIKVTDKDDNYQTVTGAAFAQGVNEKSADEIYAMSENRGTIKGTVSGSDGQTINGFSVILQDGSGNTVSGVTPTTSGNSYTIPGVISGTYKVQASANGCIASTTGPIAQGVNQDTTVQDIALQILPDISGAFSGLPSGAKPTVTVAPSNGTLNVTSSGYTITDVAPDTTYTVTATYSGYTAAPLTVPVAKVNVANADIAFTAATLLNVTVSGFGGTVPTDAKLTLTPSGGGTAIVKTISQNGQFSLSSADISAGTYNVSASATGYTMTCSASVVNLQAGSAVELTVTAAENSQPKSYYYRFGKTSVPADYAPTGCTLEVVNHGGNYLKITPTSTDGTFVIWGFTFQPAAGVTPQDQYSYLTFTLDSVLNTMNSNRQNNAIPGIISASGEFYYIYKYVSGTWSAVQSKISYNAYMTGSYHVLGADSTSVSTNPAYQVLTVNTVLMVP